MRPIPVYEAERLAKLYGYDQVTITAREVGANPAPHGEHVTAYGINPDHCATPVKTQADPCPACPPDVVCKTPTCGRLSRG